MNKLTLSLLLATGLIGCTSEKSPVEPESVKTPVELMATTDVLLLSDHTLPGHLNLSSGGANGEERLFIDPTLASLTPKLEALGLSVYTLNVEDMDADKDIQTKDEFNAAYAKYDKVVQAAVDAKTTILAVHYDANIIPAADYKDGNQYVGGAQVILDQRATSQASIDFSNAIIFEGKILQLLNDTGLRIRPDYDDEIRYQGNLTMNIAGHSEGGATLLEIGPQEQAQQLFGEKPEEIVAAIQTPLQSLAQLIKTFRDSKGLDN